MERHQNRWLAFLLFGFLAFWFLSLEEENRWVCTSCGYAFKPPSPPSSTSVGWVLLAMLLFGFAIVLGIHLADN